MNPLAMALQAGSIPQAERRWLPEAGEALAFLETAGASLIGVPDEGPFVRTTYFDTPRFTLAAAPGGVRARIRLREYADDRARARGAALELKLSTGDVRIKERVRLGADEAAAARAGELAWLAVTARGEAPGLAAWIDRLGDELDPVAMTFYRRHALRTPDGRVRVTLDEDIKLCRPAAPGAPLLPTGDLVVATLPAHVLEVKGDDALPPALERAIHGLGEPRELSKYEIALAAVRRAATGRTLRAGGSAARLAAAAEPR